MRSYNIIVSPYQKNTVDSQFYFKQNDFGIPISITVEDYDTNGTTASIVFRRHDGVIREYNITQSSDGTYKYNLSADELRIVGKVIVDIKFYANNVRESTASFIYYVISDKISQIFESGDYSDSISKAIARCDQAITNIQEQANQAIQDVENALLAELNIYDGTDKTEVGYAADARQLNENVPGSFAESVKNRIGLLANLTTSTKGNIVAAVNELNNNLQLIDFTGTTLSYSHASGMSMLELPSIPNKSIIAIYPVNRVGGLTYNGFFTNDWGACLALLTDGSNASINNTEVSIKILAL